MLVHLKEILEKAQQGNYALGAFNPCNLETTIGIVRGAVAKQKPVIIQVSEGTIDYAGLKPITHIVKTIAKNEAVDVPVALHLDHGRSFHSIAECIKAGFSSIMIDASDLPFDENIALTKQAVDYAHQHGVLAQGELGEVVRDVAKINEATLTDPAQAEEFVKATGVDTLAVSIGNIHGIIKMRKGVPKLDLERLKSIHEKVKIPLVLHGASGLGAAEIKKAIGLGIRIINIHTEVNLAFTETLRWALTKSPEEVDPRKYLSQAIEAVQKMVEEKLEMFS
jgi:fructose-bisphosphate aldolase class II